MSTRGTMSIMGIMGIMGTKRTMGIIGTQLIPLTKYISFIGTVISYAIV